MAYFHRHLCWSCGFFGVHLEVHFEVVFVIFSLILFPTRLSVAFPAFWRALFDIVFRTSVAGFFGAKKLLSILTAQVFTQYR